MAVAYRTKMTISPTQNGRDNAIMLKSDHFLKDLSPKHLRYQNYNKKKWVFVVNFWNLFDHVNGIYGVTKPSTRHKNPITNRKLCVGSKLQRGKFKSIPPSLSRLVLCFVFAQFHVWSTILAIIRGWRRVKPFVGNFKFLNKLARLVKFFNLRQISIWCLAFWSEFPSSLTHTYVI